MKKTLVAALAAGLIFGGANVSTEAATTDSALSLQGTQLEIVEVMHHTPKGFGPGPHRQVGPGPHHQVGPGPHHGGGHYGR